MQSEPAEIIRQVVPRWRSIVRTPRRELENHRLVGPIDPAVDRELARRVEEWTNKQDHNSAQELVWASAVFGSSEITRKSLISISETANFSETLRDDAKLIVNPSADSELSLSLNFSSHEIVRQHIRIVKSRIRIAPEQSRALR